MKTFLEIKKDFAHHARCYCLCYFTTDSKHDFQMEISSDSSPSDMEGFKENNFDRILFSEVSVVHPG